MENQSAGLPPINPVVPVVPMPTGFPAAPPRLPAGNPVGRPSNDPAQNEARIEKSRKTARLEGLTPTRAKDDKLNVFQTSNGRARGKPVLTLLASEIEEALGQNPDGNQLDDMISQQMPDKYPDGTYKCQWYDRNNRPVTEPPAWEIDIGDPADFEEEEEVDDGLGPADDPRTMPVVTAFPQPAAVPPPAPVIDLAAVGGALREERREEGRRGNEMMTLVMSMQQMSQQQMQQMAQQQQQQMQQQQQWQREADERDRIRRQESRTTTITLITTMVPLVLPMIQAWMAPKTAGPSPEMSALLELVKGMATNKSSDVMVLEKMMEFQGKMTERQMDLQSKGAGTAVEMQAKATSMVFDNMLSNMKKLMDNKPAESEGDGGVLSTIGKIAGPFLANMAQNQQAPPEMEQAPPQQRAPRQPQSPSAKPQPPEPEHRQEQVVEPARRARRVARPTQAPVPTEQASAPAAIDPATVPAVKRVEGCLNVIRKLSLGKPPPNERWRAVAWVAKWLPDDVMAAVKAEDIPKAMTLGTEAALSNATILQWITDEGNQEFLKDVLTDVRLLVMGLVTQEIAEASIIKHGQFVQRRQNAVQQADQQAEEAIRRHNSPPDTNEGPKLVAEATVVPPAGAPAAPVEGSVAPPTAPANPSEPAPRPTKPPPPSAN